MWVAAIGLAGGKGEDGFVGADSGDALVGGARLGSLGLVTCFGLGLSGWSRWARDVLKGRGLSEGFLGSFEPRSVHLVAAANRLPNFKGESQKCMLTVVLGGLEFPQGNINGDTTHALGLKLVKHAACRSSVQWWLTPSMNSEARVGLALIIGENDLLEVGAPSAPLAL
ncbi:hypothetical protein MLD38_022220 [Melastoma candidum]|uniref:Uncharacterized protein n=1 Tax=Melastoma candidum TaxID=119954 RepID=A0ACB9QJK7_9MYRT|nr:hypothetical protein MLD38_022220 [Melastoma candidum]